MDQEVTLVSYVQAQYKRQVWVAGVWGLSNSDESFFSGATGHVHAEESAMHVTHQPQELYEYDRVRTPSKRCDSMMHSKTQHRGRTNVCGVRTWSPKPKD